MSLPISLVVHLGLQRLYQDRIQLIDGRVLFVDIYPATVIWNGLPRPIDVQALGKSTLIGTALLAGHDLAIRATEGGAVSIDSVP